MPVRRGDAGEEETGAGMSDDVATNLRVYASNPELHSNYADAMQTAADEIERLRAEVERLRRYEDPAEIVGEVVEIDEGDEESGPHAWVSLHKPVDIGALLMDCPAALKKEPL